MSKKKRTQMQRRPRQVETESVEMETEDGLMGISLSVEPLTDELYTDLLSQGWREDTLQFYKAMGWRYSHLTKSFWSDTGLLEGD